MRLIENTLGIGQVVDRGDRTMANTQVFVDHFDHRSQAIGGAGCGGNNTVLRRIEQVLIDAHDDVQRPLFLHRCTDHHALHTLFQIRLKHDDGLHSATGFDDQVAAGPVSVGDGFVGRHSHASTVNDHAIVIGAGFVVPTAVHRVEIDQVRMSDSVARRVVDVHEFKLGPVPGRAQGKTTDSTETVDTYSDAHGAVLFRVLSLEGQDWPDRIGCYVSSRLPCAQGDHPSDQGAFRPGSASGGWLRVSPGARRRPTVEVQGVVGSKSIDLDGDFRAGRRCATEQGGVKSWIGCHLAPRSVHTRRVHLAHRASA
ncbi:hypothetical protein D3C76_880900 [compost metagenome]